MSEKAVPHGYKIALYPTPPQKRALEQCFGNTRFVFNQYIRFHEWEYEHGHTKVSTGRKTFSQVRTILTVENKKKQYQWLRKAPAGALQEACRQADYAYQRMIRTRVQGKKARMPFRKKYGRQSFRLPDKGSFKIRETDAKRHYGHVYVPKVGWIRYHAGKKLEKASSITIIKDVDGLYAASVNLPYEKPTSESDATLAIDVGLTTLVTGVSSDGKLFTVDNPRLTKRYENQLRKEQRKLSRKKERTKKYNKQKRKVAQVHKKIQNTRNDYLHKVSHDVAVNSHDVICEDLNVSGMVKNRRYAKSISDASWAKLLNNIAYKLSGSLTKVDRFFPSSKTCSQCGTKRETLPVSVRTWKCDNCHVILDRDNNAAVNLLVAGGHSETLNACGVDVRRLSQPLSALKLEYFCTTSEKVYGDNHTLLIHWFNKEAPSLLGR